MRSLLFSVALVFLVGCESEESSNVPGRITKARAVAIALDAGQRNSYPLTNVARVAWRNDPTAATGGYWAIDLSGPDEDYGRFYLVDGKGQIVGQGRFANDHYF
ncbi:MAG: hypothetical protein JO331_03490 [Verrucomicrobia bacterium]|nr:hypothetical protein [Verrucomicrobiota bacterium]